MALIAKEHSDANRKQYRKKGTGTLVHVYEVFGTDAELQEYKDAQGSQYREDTETGNPLFFTVRPFIKNSGKLGISQSGTVYQDTSEFDKVKSIVEANGGNFGDVLAKQMLSDLLGNNSSNTVSQPANQPADSSGLGDY